METSFKGDSCTFAATTPLWPFALPHDESSRRPDPDPVSMVPDMVALSTLPSSATSRQLSMDSQMGTVVLPTPQPQSAEPPSPSSLLFQQKIDRAVFLELLQSAGSPPSPSQTSPFSSVPVEVVLAGPSEYRRSKAVKRREQNKRSQQTYRARKEQYRHSLDTDIQSASAYLDILRHENCTLLKTLCDLLAENDKLRRLDTTHCAPDNTSVLTHQFEQAILANASSTVGSATTEKVLLSKEAIQALHYPLQAFRNLLSSHLGYKADGRDFIAAMERLQSLIDQQSSAPDRDTALQYL